jgi:hypothetical protein
MTNPNIQETTVTKISAKKKPHNERPLMSYTAVTSRREMAEAFVTELLTLGRKIMPDHDLTTEDIIEICHLTLTKRNRGVVMLEGRHLRGRVGEQVSRANRYKEPFSLLVLKLDGAVRNTANYDAVIDTLCERMRQTDIMFLFKSRLVLILPHTPTGAREMLVERIRLLVNDALKDIAPPIDLSGMTYPDAQFPKTQAVLDWVEDHLRTYT